MSELNSYPPLSKWDHWEEFDYSSWPKREKKSYTLVPTVCFNCEAACGLVAYVDKKTFEVKKFEGNPYNPASRGRNCSKGPATINQVNDPERILYPLKRVGNRGEGKWERVSWNEVLDTVAEKIRSAIKANRKNEIMYHVGRPGEDGFVERTLQAWGVDAHNSHTNVCSSSARLGYALWMCYDRPSPDYTNARFILLLSSHLEAGHYFAPHAQRIIDAKSAGAKIAVIDTRLSNTASMADYWLPTQPGSEAAVLLAMANVIINENLYNKEFVRKWVNWEEFLRYEYPNVPVTFENFYDKLKEVYSTFTPEYAQDESGLDQKKIVQVAREIAQAGSRFSAHVWRNAASGNLGGWQVARALVFLNVLTGSVGTPGGTLPNGWNKFVPVSYNKPSGQKVWNELLYPKEYPFSHFEMSFLLPYFLKEGRGKVSVYFTRAYNPVWTNPDGFSWIEMLTDETKIGLHCAVTPTWNETAQYADFVLPMGLGPERHDTMSFESHSGKWIGFRQPVLRVAREKLGEKFNATYEANPGEVWEEAEFWIELSLRIDPDGSLGISKYFESPYRAGDKMTVEDYYRWIFENSVPGLAEKAKEEGLAPFDYMRKYGAFEVLKNQYDLHEKEIPLDGTAVDPQTQVIKKNGAAVGIMVDGKPRTGFPTPSRKLEFYSRTLVEWGWKEYAIPGYIKSHVHPDHVDSKGNEFTLLPTFRLPTQIHTRSGNSKWLWELSNTNPVWIHPKDMKRLGIKNGQLVRVNTRTGYFVNRVWMTEGIKPGVVGCSHHFGRWRIHKDSGSRWSMSLVNIDKKDGKWMLRYVESFQGFKSKDSDSERISRKENGVHQNLTFPSHPDPLSGMHCWHQKVSVEKAKPEDKYGDVVADTNKSFEIYKEWLKMTKLPPGNLRRPLWLARPFRPDVSAFNL